MVPEDKIPELIEEVRNVPCLWDKSHSDYKKHELRDRAWEKIGLILAVTGDEAKSKWNYLRDQFSAKMKKLPSGSASNDAEKWRYFDSLSFLKGTIKPRKSESNINSSAIIGIDIDNETIDTETELNEFYERTEESHPESSDSITHQFLPRQQQSSSVGESKSYGKRKQMGSDLSEINSLIAERLKRPKTLESADDHFGKYVAEHLAPLPKILKLQTCTKISELLCQAHEKLSENSD